MMHLKRTTLVALMVVAAVLGAALGGITVSRAELRRPRLAQAPPIEAPILPCLLYTSPSPRDRQKSRMPSSA